MSPADETQREAAIQIIRDTPERLVFEITVDELLKAARIIYASSEQVILSTLQDKGAPIYGSFVFRIEDGYTVNETYDPLVKKLIYVFTKN
jgi:hypothetical protein